jgi:hypothetical protein
MSPRSGVRGSGTRSAFAASTESTSPSSRGPVASLRAWMVRKHAICARMRANELIFGCRSNRVRLA